MIGVVLWSDPSLCKAVFWCEDQGDLAFFDGGGPYPEDFEFFDAGDLVQFEIHSDRRLRRAHNPRLIHERACQELPDRLRQISASAPGAEEPRSGAQIISFAPRTPVGAALARIREA